jgi:hypothetical protein
MPYVTEWVENEVAFEIDGVTIFHTYKDDERDQGPYRYHFTLDELGDETTAFDVRELPAAADVERAMEPARFMREPKDWCEPVWGRWKESEDYAKLQKEWDAYHMVADDWIPEALALAIKRKEGPFADHEALGFGERTFNEHMQDQEELTGE